MVSMASSRIFTGLIAAALLFGLAFPLHAKEFIKGERPQQRGYSQAVITDGGKIVWLAGQLAVVDDSGKSLVGDLDGQVRQIFKLINATLEKAGGKLSDMVQMTVFITDVRYGDRVTQIRREVFGDNFPGSALISVTALAVPEAKVEIRAMLSSEASRSLEWNDSTHPRLRRNDNARLFARSEHCIQTAAN
jgi:2-iminobutanoate/2-iminopropanoate deaminase